MALTITLSNTSGASYIFSKILQFQLKKEVYTPYTTFSAQFQTDGLKKFGTICKVIVQNGSQVVHEGTVETLTVQTNASVTTISLLSLSLIHISEPTRQDRPSRMPSSA